MTNANTDIVKQFCTQLWEMKNLDIIDRLFDAEAKIHSPFNVKFGALTMREAAEKWLTAFPDLTIQWQDFITEGSKVAVRWQATGTHMGSFFETKATNSEVYYSGVTIFTLLNEKIVEYWALVDVHSILKQVGADSLAEAID